MRWIILAAALAVALSGCASHDLEGGGHTEGEKTINKDCGTSATIEGNFGGAGKADIRVQDGAGMVVYTNSIDSSGGESFKSDLSGAPGSWTVRASFTGSGYSGGWWIDLDC